MLGMATNISYKAGYSLSGYNSVEQLEVLYSVRVREVQRLTQQLEEFSNEAAKERDEMFTKLAFWEAEQERAKSLHKEAEQQLYGRLQLPRCGLQDSSISFDLSAVFHFGTGFTTQTFALRFLSHFVNPFFISLPLGLVPSTSFSSHTLAAFSGSIRFTCSNNVGLTQEIEICRVSMLDLQQKNLLLERGSLNNTEKHVDTFMKNVSKKHEQELNDIQNKLDTTTAKLSLKESQCCQLEQRVCELTRAQEALLVEKGETINHLSRSLEESQRQCQQLMSSTASQETIGLKLQLSTTRQEKDELSKKVHTLTVSYT
ncbi:unnamed protein product [Timema podura]|uniref:Uncharacterized protein n=1 Tax=Timema podura TaxID=61482 RepID=A0ABN7P7B8_TIMPD|nr:unnamed protein product [Timema podura]